MEEAQPLAAKRSVKVVSHDETSRHGLSQGPVLAAGEDYTLRFKYAWTRPVGAKGTAVPRGWQDVLVAARFRYENQPVWMLRRATFRLRPCVECSAGAAAVQPNVHPEEQGPSSNRAILTVLKLKMQNAGKKPQEANEKPVK